MFLFQRLFFLATVLLIPTSIALSAPTEPAASSIRATTFNIRWFGLGGTMEGSPSDERRDQSIREFLSTNVLPTDVIAFEEIVDVARLRGLLPTGWTCVGYTHSAAKHQHVELCTSPRFTLAKASYDNNYTIEGVAINASKSRPAVRADLVERSSGRRLLRVIGVHLKAYPNEAATRETQAEEIAADLAQASDDLPVLVMGDFNTYPASTTGASLDDVDRIEQVLASAATRFKIRHIAHTERYTYRNNRQRSLFDHFYLTADAQVARAPWVFSVCNTNKANFTNFRYYYDNVSDHCPTTIDIELP